MDWDAFWKKTLDASPYESYAKLAPGMGISDAAISHYRTGKRVPQVWVVADALKMQGHPTPEKAAIEIMKAAALTSTERTFWKRLAATAASLIFTVSVFGHPGKSYAATVSAAPSSISGAAHSIHYAKLSLARNGLSHLDFAMPTRTPDRRRANAAAPANTTLIWLQQMPPIPRPANKSPHR